jgi:hypothetical protein
MLSFLRRHVWAAALLVGSGFLSVASRLNDVYTLINAGLPNGVWQAIGLAIFFATVIVLLARWEQGTSSKLKEEKQTGRPQNRNVKSVQFVPSGDDAFVLVISPARAGIELEVYLECSPWLPGSTLIGVTGYPRWAAISKFFLGEVRLRDEGIRSSMTVLERARDSSRFWIWKILNSEGKPSNTRPAVTHGKERVAFIFKDGGGV